MVDNWSEETFSYMDNQLTMQILNLLSNISFFVFFICSAAYWQTMHKSITTPCGKPMFTMEYVDRCKVPQTEFPIPTTTPATSTTFPFPTMIAINNTILVTVTYFSMTVTTQQTINTTTETTNDRMCEKVVHCM